MSPPRSRLTRIACRARAGAPDRRVEQRVERVDAVLRRLDGDVVDHAVIGALGDGEDARLLGPLDRLAERDVRGHVDHAQILADEHHRV